MTEKLLTGTLSLNTTNQPTSKTCTTTVSVVGRCIPSFFFDLADYAATQTDSDTGDNLKNMDGTEITGDNINTASQ